MIERLPEVGVTVISHWIFNCYVIHDGGAGRPLVIDAGLPSTAVDVATVLAGLDGADPVVVATHLHTDHVAGVAPLLADGAEVHLPGRALDWRAGATPQLPGLAAVSKIAPVLADQPRQLWTWLELARQASVIGVDPRHGLRLPFEPAGWLHDGDVVPGAPEWRVVGTAGHTDDSLSFWNERTGTLCSGDAVLAAGRRAWFNPELSDAAATAATEERLRALPVEVLLPGHGRPAAGEVWRHALAPHELPPGTSRLLARIAGH